MMLIEQPKQTQTPAPPRYVDGGLLPAFHEVRPSRAARTVALILVAVFLGLALFLLFVPWQQSVDAAGRVVALTPIERQQTIDAPVEGRVRKWHVIEGTRVKVGDPVFEISDNDPDILEKLRAERQAVSDRLAAARQREAAVADRIERLMVSRRTGLEAAQNRIEMAVERVRAAERALDAAEARQLAAKLNQDRQKVLLEKGLTATRSRELADMEYAQATAEVERARNTLNAAKVERDALTADRAKFEADMNASIEDAKATRAAAQAEIASTLATLQQTDVRVTRQGTQMVTAPREGTILRLLAQPGSELLKAGDPVAILVPDAADPTVELWVKGNDVPLVSKGNKVRLQFEGWPAVQFVGWPSVAVGTFGGIVTLVDATDDGKGKFRLLVRPDPDDAPWPSARYLRQGVRANGWVLLNMVPLWFELWRQYNGFPPVIAMDEPGASGEDPVKRKDK
jgi:multidrug efflux pump subunit AcrA (membrane-fusion protein)